MNEQPSTNYSIPARYRQLENLHILFWLLKDLSWCLIWKELGIAMIIPTLSAAVYIAYRTRKIISELVHNLAIVFWILANSYWMISEFYGFEMLPIVQNFTAKHLAIIPFVIGLSILLYYYLILKRTEIQKENIITL